MNLPSKLIRSFLLSLVVAMGIYAVSVIASDVGQVSEAMVGLGAEIWLLILGLSFLNYILRFLRWHGYLKKLGYRVPLSKDLAYYLAGFAFTTTPAKAGEAVRSVYLKQHAVSYCHSLAALFVERLQDFLAIVLLAMLAAFEFEDTRWPVIIMTALMLAVLPALQSERFFSFLERLRAKLPDHKLKAAGQHMLSLLRSSSSLLRSYRLYGGLFLGLVSWGAEGVAFFLILQAVGFPLPVELAIGIYAISILAGAVTFLPGGLGSTEAVMGLLLVLAGAEPAIALAATLICRIATLWFAVAIGIVVMSGLEMRRWHARRATGVAPLGNTVVPENKI